MTNLSTLFPLFNTRQEVIDEIRASSKLSRKFDSWKAENQDRFVEICTGNRGLRILYDVYFQEIFNPDTNKKRIAELLSVILEVKVESVEYLRRESSLIYENQSLLILDIVVKLEDGSIVNVEMQKVGYKFPGERACCYSSDLVLRQYGSGKKDNEKFTYKDMKPVYSIIFIEKSTGEFHEMEDIYIHRFSQKSNTGLKLSLLQNYVFIPLDMFRKSMVKKGDKKLTKLEAWLLFLSSDAPDDILRIIDEYPEFEEIYRQIFEICQNVERMIDMFSIELSAIDKNTVNYMIDELQEEVRTAKTRADEAEDKADREKARADEAEDKADREKARADEAEDKADREKARADEAEDKADREKARADEAENKADREKARADKAQDKVSKAENRLVEMTVENKRLKEEQEAALQKDKEEIKKMYEDGLSLETISKYKKRDVSEIKKIIGA